MGTSTKEKNTTQTTMLSTLPLVSITSSTHSAHRPPAFQLTTCAVVVTMDLTTGSDSTRTSAATETLSAPTTSAKSLRPSLRLLQRHLQRQIVSGNILKLQLNERLSNTSTSYTKRNKT